MYLLSSIFSSFLLLYKAAPYLNNYNPMHHVKNACNKNYKKVGFEAIIKFCAQKSVLEYVQKVLELKHVQHN